MRLASILFLMFFIQISAVVYSQTTTFNFKFENKQIVEALKEIEESSKYRFFYVREQVNVEKIVSLRAKKATIDQILTDLFKGQGINFQIMDDYLILLSPEQLAYEKTIELESNKTITGSVSDEFGQPLTGVNVYEVGTTSGTITDRNGNYRISNISEKTILCFSFLGMTTSKIQVADQTIINAKLTTDVIGIEEVIALGYGLQLKTDLTGSVGIIESKIILENSTFNAIQGIKGKIAGVNIFSNSGSPTGNTRVIIRGINSIETTSSPLYVVDGVVMEDFHLLNPNDIDRIEVLKDASSAAIYGARGANGVILVTTKRGANEGEIIIGYDTYLSIGTIRKKMDLLNSEEWLEVIKRGYANAPKYKDYLPGDEPRIDFTDPNLFHSNGKPIYDTDWQDEATRTAISHNHQFSLQQGSKKSSVGAFLNYTDNQGILLNSYMKRANAKIAFDASPKKWLDFGINMLVNRTWENEIQEEGGGQYPRRTMIEFVPILPVNFPDGSWSNSSSTNNFALEGMANPVHVLTTQERLRDRTHLFGNTFLNFHILPELDFKTQFGVDNHIYKFLEYDPKDLVNISFPNGRASIENQESFYWQQESFLKYNRSIEKHRINSVLGLSWQERSFRSNRMNATGFSDDELKYNNLGSANDPDAPESFYEKWAMNSYFTRVGYSFDEKYLATLTARIDGSSRFGANNKYGFFPSAGFGWIVSNEEFLKNNRFLNYLKFRSSYGITGNSELGTYQSLATINGGTVLLNGERVSTYEVTRLPNPNLEWEKTSQLNLGVNLSILDKRMNFEVDYYYKLTNDLLLSRPVPHSTGYQSVTDNIGSVSNRGVDFSLTTYNINNINFSWLTSLSLNFNRNRIEELGENGEDILPGPFWVSGSQTILRVGESLGSFWGYKRLGVWGTNERDEAAEVGAIPGVAKRSSEREILGDGLPDFTGSIINRLNYKNFDFTLDLQFVSGVEIMQQFLHSTEDRTGYANGLSTILYNGWTETNQNTMIQQIRNASLNGQNSEVDDHWVVDGSYLRANLISIGYSLKQKSLSKLKLNSCRIFTSIDNAFVIHSSDFMGYDPEATTWGDNQWGQNIFFFQYPKPTTITLGVNVKF